ncbi:hypothetical protein [Amycolatopsis pigmentata]|uniref:Uncharacterized protein n=1 Tax=Amycolatopsis pigmentata TaxID=450801 RepID=A0ABW5FLG2_9PSEU
MVRRGRRARRAVVARIGTRGRGGRGCGGAQRHPVADRFPQPGIVAVEGLLLPAGLLAQLLRGPEVLLIGLVLLGNGIAFTAPVTIVLCVLAIIF